MLRTNTKKARDNVKAYIMANYDGSAYNYSETTDFKEAARNIYEVYKREREAVREHRNQNEQELFTIWLQNSTAIIDAGYYWNRSAVDDLGDILEETPAERAKFTEAQAENYLSYLIFSEITKAARTA